MINKGGFQINDHIFWVIVEMVILDGVGSPRGGQDVTNIEVDGFAGKISFGHVKHAGKCARFKSGVAKNTTDGLVWSGEENLYRIDVIILTLLGIRKVSFLVVECIPVVTHG